MLRIQKDLVATGVDPHPTSHTAIALNGNGKVVGSSTVSRSSKGPRKPRAWSSGFESGVG